MLRHAKNVGDYEAAWYRNYGSVFRIAGVFNVCTPAFFNHSDVVTRRVGTSSPGL